MRVLSTISIAAGLLFSTFSSFAQFNYPTIWNLHNPNPNPVHVQCRLYAGGWNTWDAMDYKFVVAGNQTLTHRFPDYSEGLGMFYRGWSCAVSQTINPLMQASSIGFSFQGDHNTTMEIPSLIRLTSTLSSENVDSDTSAEEVYCPLPTQLIRLHDCNSPRCTWDRYGTADRHWFGMSSPSLEASLPSLKFRGVDAIPTGTDALGCLYEASTGESLILLSYLATTPSGGEVRFRYKPSDVRLFNKQSGALTQCFGATPQKCPLARK